MPTTSHRYEIPPPFTVDPLLPPVACFARPDSPLGQRLMDAEMIAFPEAPELFREDDTTLMMGIMLKGEIRHVMRLSVPLLGTDASMPFLLRDLIASGQELAEGDLVAFYQHQGIDLARAVSVETNVRVGDAEGDVSSADLAYLAVFDVMQRINAHAVFAHLNDAARSSFRRVDLMAVDILDREDLRTPGTTPGEYDERYRPVCLPAHAHNVAVIRALASLMPAPIWSPAPPEWWEDAHRGFTPLPDAGLSTPTVKRATARPSVDIDLTDDGIEETLRKSREGRASDGQTGLHITVRLGRGSGPTHLAAFDAALRQAGVADRNLIPLSSIVPPGATVERTPTATTCPGGWGDRLYVVMAEARVERPHEEAWAGIAWRQDPETGEGLFVEHHGHSEHQVTTDLISTIEAITASRDDREWASPELAVVGVVCQDEPVCALAVACFQSDPWRLGDPVDLRDG